MTASSGFCLNNPGRRSHEQVLSMMLLIATPKHTCCFLPPSVHPHIRMACLSTVGDEILSCATPDRVRGRG